MKKILKYSILSIVLMIISTNCTKRTVSRVNPDKEIDLSGRWNDVDSKLVAEDITSQALKGKWLSDFKTNKGKNPVIIAGMVDNKSHEHIEAETFVNDLEKAFIKSEQVRVVQAGKKREELRMERADQQTNSSVSTMKKFGLEVGADFILQGSINSIVDAYKKEKVVYYQIDMQLTDLQTNEVVWIGEKKIKKFVKN